jgi:hypothetical protein
MKTSPANFIARLVTTEARPLRYYAYWMRVQVVATPPAGGIRLPLAIGAVVLLLLALQTPLSGQSEPVRAVVPIG